MRRPWKVPQATPKDALKQFPEMHPIIVQLLERRGINTQRDVERFMTPDYVTDSHDPFLFRDMQKAVDRILQAAERKEKVVVYGDYDADGVCASSILYEMFEKLGITAHVHLPHREKEGYGLNMPAAKEFIKQGFHFIITCDCGITSFDEITELQKAGIDVVVTDHHLEPEKMPPAFAILNSSLKKETYPFKDLVGTGVVFKLAQAVYLKLREAGKVKEGEEKWFLDLVAIATIADYGTLVDENRTFSKFGLVVLEKTKRLGLKSLFEFMNGKGKALSAETIAYQLVPRLNAASRMDHANLAFELLIEKDAVKAFTFAEQLNQLNQKRQKVSEKMYQEAKKQIGENPEERILVAFQKDWPAGVLGLVAGKLLQLYGRPVLVMTQQEGDIVGSGRSIESFDITAALRDAASSLLKFGGHPQACGFTIKKGKKSAFLKSMKQSGSKIKDDDVKPELIIDAEINLDDINWELFDQLRQFEPFGEGNPQPVFAARKAVVESVRVVGNTGKHMQLTVRQGSQKIHKTIAFNFAEDWSTELPQGTLIDMAFEISVNEWNGNRELQLSLVDIQKS